MRTRVWRQGQSLTLRIPKALAEQAGIEGGAEVDLSTSEGKPLIAPVTESGFSLAQLLAGVTDENLHGEIGTGPTVGKEAW